MVDATTLELRAEGALRDARHAAGGVHRRHHPDRLRHREPGRHRRLHLQVRSTPGKTSTFTKYADYWGDPAFVDELQIQDFADDSAKVNALQAGQIQTVDNLPYNLIDTIKGAGGGVLVSETGAWVPFTMRVDVGAVLRRPGAPGDAADRRPPADDRPGAERLRLARQRPVRAVRRGLRQRPAPARAGHRPGQVAAQRRPARRASRSSCSPATTSARSRRRRPTCSSSRPSSPASTSRSPRRPRSTTTTTCPTPSPRTSGTPATTSRRPPSVPSRRTGRHLQRDPLRDNQESPRPGQPAAQGARRDQARPSCSTTPRRSSTTRAASSSGASASRSTATAPTSRASSRASTSRSGPTSSRRSRSRLTMTDAATSSRIRWRRSHRRGASTAPRPGPCGSPAGSAWPC